jgi:hypothetical protein
MELKREYADPEQSVVKADVKEEAAAVAAVVAVEAATSATLILNLPPAENTDWFAGIWIWAVTLQMYAPATRRLFTTQLNPRAASLVEDVTMVSITTVTGSLTVQNRSATKFHAVLVILPLVALLVSV